MKNFRKYIPYNSLLALLAVLTLTVSCKDEKEELNLSRTFRPSAFNIDAGEREAVIAWNPSLFAEPESVSYRIEISEDPYHTKNIFAADTSVNSITLSYPFLTIRKPYYARVKALASDPAKDSEWSMSEAFAISGDQFLYLEPNDAEVLDTRVILRWLDRPGLTKITVTPENNTPFDIELTEADHDTLMILLRDLTPVTNYMAELFAGEETKGLVTFTTKAAITGDNVIDLREVEGGGTMLTDTLNGIPSGSIVILKRGEIYEINTYDFDRSVKIVSGLDFAPEYAKIYLTGNFNILAGLSIDSLVFQDVNFEGEDFNGDYVFNFSREGTIGKISYENCRVHRVRGFNRAQTGGAGTIINSLVVNNCVIDSVREYGVATASSASSITNITITNSTIFKARKLIDHRVPGANSLLIENCTLNEMPGTGGGGATYVIDFNTADIATPVTIRNVILGTTWPEVGGTQAVNGYRLGSSSTLTSTSSYRTSDFTVTAGQFNELSVYNGASTALWVDPANGDFRFKDNGFSGKDIAGDPRWRE